MSGNNIGIGSAPSSLRGTLAKTTRATVKIETVLPNPRNNNIHPPEQIDFLKASIARFGQPRPVLVRKANRMLAAGHGIHQAMLEMGQAEIEVILWDVDQQTADEFMLADNRLGQLSHFDPDRTRELLGEIPDYAYAALGFTEDDIQSLFGDGGSSFTPTVREIETSDISDSFWISVRGPLAKQAIALQRIQHLMSEFPDVEVELGTIAIEL
jgi:hypothetical protein